MPKSDLIGIELNPRRYDRVNVFGRLLADSQKCEEICNSGVVVHGLRAPRNPR